MPQSDAEIARVQAAIGDAYDDWVQGIDAAGEAPPPTMTPDGPSEYPQFAYLLDATPEQQDALQKAVNDGISRAGAEPSAD